MERPIGVQLLKNKDQEKNLENGVNKHGRAGSAKSLSLHGNIGKPSKNRTLESSQMFTANKQVLNKEKAN